MCKRTVFKINEVNKNNKISKKKKLFKFSFKNINRFGFSERAVCSISFGTNSFFSSVFWNL